MLVVEDDTKVQATVIAMFTDLGYTVLKADNADQAIAVLSSGVHIDLLFTDVVMPGTLKSPEMARRAVQLQPHLRVLFTSGYTQNAIVHGGRLDPNVELISKPYSRKELAAKVRQVLGSEGLPLKNGADSVSASTPEVAERMALRVLVVEDDEPTRDAVSELLRLLGHCPTTASSAQSAIDAFDEASFDVLLTDVHLPDLSGIELAHRIATVHRGISVIFASGDTVQDNKPGDFHWLSLRKPYAVGQLEAALRKARRDNA